jgi:carbonic anhydrase
MVPTKNLKNDILNLFSMANLKRAAAGTMMALITANASSALAHAPETPQPHGTKTSAAPHPVHWDHNNQDKWSEISGVCSSGQFQSPINLTSENAPVDLPSWQAHYKDAELHTHQNGHTFEIQYPAGSKVVLGGKEYELVQFHFHTPSEYTLDGERFPMEAHFVHKDKEGNLLVIGMMMAEGAENPVLAKIWDHMPAKPGDPQAHPGVTINAADFYPPQHGTGESVPYFQLMGSLTTPPCTENVTWIVLKEPMKVSHEQIERFRKLFPEGNARELQPIRSHTPELGY